jgi:1-deoxy-D-xylulose-5-phosphate synthase
MEQDELINKIKKIDIKKLSFEEERKLSNEIRQYIVECCSINGGHLSSNLGDIELTLALHKAFSFPKDKLLFDVGHQCYTHKILSGRSLKNLRTKGVITGFQNREESPYDVFDAGHSSTSISTAMGLALARDLNNEDYNVIALIGDASLSNGLAFEALNNIQELNHKIIIIINDNNMSISKSVGALHEKLQELRVSSKYLKASKNYKTRLQRNFITRGFFKLTKFIKDGLKFLFFRANFFEDLGVVYYGSIDGYDFKQMQKVFNKAKKTEKSVVIHVSTIKGKGYDGVENNSSSWHSVKPFDLKTGKPITTKDDNITMQTCIYATELTKVMDTDPKAVVITPATSLGSKLDKLFKKYPERCIDVGINEEHALTFASGYGLSGNHAYVSIYSTFLQRGYDEILHDIARLNVPVTLLIDHAGLVGQDGKTHQGIFDESFLINMPNMTVAMAKNYSQTKKLFAFASSYSHPIGLRTSLDKIVIKDTEEKDIVLNKWEIDNSLDHNKVLISFGPKLQELEDMNLDITYVNAIFQSSIDEDVMMKIMDAEEIIIYNPYAIEQGFVYHVQDYLIHHGYKGKIKKCAIRNEFIDCATIHEQEIEQGVDITSILKLINEK